MKNAIWVLLTALALLPACQSSSSSGDDDTDTGTFDCTGGVLDGDFEIHEAQDVIALQGYTGVSGRLLVSETSLTDLQGLECLVEVGSDFEISMNPELTGLDGLSVLESVGGDLDIWSNEKLESLDGLAAIAHVGGIDIGWLDEGYPGNTALTSIEALYRIEEVERHILILHNDSLASLSGLENLRRVGINLWLGDNALDDLTGLTGLERIDGSFYFSESLPNLHGLESLVEIDSDLVIYSGGSLQGLGNLERIGHTLEIRQGAQLQDLQELDSLIDLNGLFIWLNSSLQSLSGLEEITEIDQINIDGAALETFSGLDNLTVVHGDFWVEGVGELTQLDALAQLTAIEGDLLLEETGLTNLDGLENLGALGGELVVRESWSLPTCEATALRDQLVSQGWSGTACIEQNLSDSCEDDLSGCE